MPVSEVIEDPLVTNLPTGLPACEASHTRILSGTSIGPCDGVASWLAVRSVPLVTAWNRALVCDAWRRQNAVYPIPQDVRFYPL